MAARAGYMVALKYPGALPRLAVSEAVRRMLPTAASSGATATAPAARARRSAAARGESDVEALARLLDGRGAVHRQDMGALLTAATPLGKHVQKGGMLPEPLWCGACRRGLRRPARRSTRACCANARAAAVVSGRCCRRCCMRPACLLRSAPCTARATAPRVAHGHCRRRLERSGWW